MKTFERDFTINNLKMVYVYNNIPPATKEEVFDLWRQYSPLTTQMQEKRIDQVAYVIKHNEKVVGVTTSYMQKIMKNNNIYYFFRTFIAPSARGMIGARFPDLVRATNQRMQEENRKKPLALGMIVVTENPKLMQPGFKKIFSREGWQYKGKYRKQDVWLYPYK